MGHIAGRKGQDGTSPHSDNANDMETRSNLDCVLEAVERERRRGRRSSTSGRWPRIFIYTAMCIRRPSGVLACLIILRLLLLLLLASAHRLQRIILATVAEMSAFGSSLNNYITGKIKYRYKSERKQHDTVVVYWLTFYGTVKPHSSRPLCSNTVISTLAVDGWVVTFGTTKKGLGGLLAVANVTAHPYTASVPTSYYSTRRYNYLCTLHSVERS